MSAGVCVVASCSVVSISVRRCVILVGVVNAGSTVRQSTAASALYSNACVRL